MVGTLLNGAAIVAGGAAGLAARRQMSARTQQLLKVLLGLLTVYVGLSMAWVALRGSFGHFLKGAGLTLAALMLGTLTGRLLGLQRRLNRLGKYARERWTQAQGTADHAFSEGFVTCSILYCVGPMAIVGALQDGLTGDFKTLAIKAALDGISTLAFAQAFGWSVLLSAVPVVAYQGTITLLARVAAPHLQNQALLDPIYAAGGFILFAVALVILDIKKVQLADYLPSLVYAPVLAWLAR